MASHHAFAVCVSLVKQTLGGLVAGYAFHVVTLAAMAIQGVLSQTGLVNGKPITIPGCMIIVFSLGLWSLGWAQLGKLYSFTLARTAWLALVASLSASWFTLAHHIGDPSATGLTLAAGSVTALILFVLACVLHGIVRHRGHQHTGDRWGDARPSVGWIALVMATLLAVPTDLYTRRHTASAQYALDVIRHPSPATKLVTPNEIYHVVDATGVYQKVLAGRGTRVPLAGMPNHWLGVIRPHQPDPYGVAAQIRVFTVDPSEGLAVTFRDVVPMPIMLLDAGQLAVIESSGPGTAIHEAFAQRISQLQCRPRKSNEAWPPTSIIPPP